MKIITKTDLLDLIANILFIAEQKIIPKLGPNQDLASCLFVADSARDIIGVTQLDIPEQYEAKVHMDAVIRQALDEVQAVAYAVTMMGWMRELTPGEDVASAGRISEHPDRIETFIILAGSKTAYTSKMYRVIRNKEEKISRLEGLHDERAEQHGLFVDMLGARPSSRTLH